jgi:hypothetical protein
MEIAAVTAEARINLIVSTPWGEAVLATQWAETELAKAARNGVEPLSVAEACTKLAAARRSGTNLSLYLTGVQQAMERRNLALGRMLAIKDGPRDGRLMVSVHGAFGLKDALKARGYRFNSRGGEKCWQREIGADYLHNEIATLTNESSVTTSNAICNNKPSYADTGHPMIKPTSLPKQIKFQDYMVATPRNDAMTICVYIETPAAWVMAEIPRAAIPDARDDYQAMADQMRDYAATPEGAADMLFPGETFDDAEADHARSFVFNTMADGSWTSQRAPLMAMAYHIAELTITDLMLTHEQISSCEIVQKKDGDDLCTTVGFWCRQSVQARNSDPSRVVDGNSRYVSVQSITRH